MKISWLEQIKEREHVGDCCIPIQMMYVIAYCEMYTQQI